jgi:uncharacterized membrane-anchored protein
MKKLIIALFVLVVIAQLFVPFSMIKGREKILSDGTTYLFRTRPIDPADPFQGRYVVLRFEDDYIPAPESDEYELHRKQKIYALLGTDADGYAQFTGRSLDRPETGNYLRTTCLGRRRDWDSQTQISTHLGHRIKLPFDRYYMNEEKAPAAERAARQASNTTNCWASVKILNGKATLEDVLIGGISVHNLPHKK